MCTSAQVQSKFGGLLPTAVKVIDKRSCNTQHDCPNLATIEITIITTIKTIITNVIITTTSQDYYCSLSLLGDGKTSSHTSETPVENTLTGAVYDWNRDVSECACVRAQ